MKKSDLLRRICCTFIAFFLLTPTIKIPGFIGLRLDDLLAFSIAGYFIWSINSVRINVKVPVRASLILVFFLLLLVSMTWGLTFNLPTNILDLTKYIWLFKMLIIYLVFYNYIYFNNYELSSPIEVEKRRDYILNFIVTVGAISALICISQYINPLGINKYYIPIIAPTQFSTLLEGYAAPRVVGMIGNPNAQGYLMAMTLVVSVFLLFKCWRKTLLLKFVVIAVAMLLTLSRSALLCFLFGFVIVFFLYKKNKNFVYLKILLFTLILSFVTLLVIYLKENEVVYNLVIWRFEALLNIMEDKSFLARIHGWIINLEYFSKSPIFGVGPVPRGVDVFGASDNEWLYFLRAYGAVGTIWLLLFFFSPFLFSKRAQSISEKNYSYFTFSILLMTCLYMVPAAVITSSSINSLFIALLAFKDKQLWLLVNGIPSRNHKCQ